MREYGINLRMRCIIIERNHEIRYTIRSPSKDSRSSQCSCAHIRSIKACRKRLNTDIINAVMAAIDAARFSRTERTNSQEMTITSIGRKVLTHLTKVTSRCIKATQLRKRRKIIRVGHYTNGYAAGTFKRTCRTCRKAEHYFQTIEIIQIREYYVVVNTIELQIRAFEHRRSAGSGRIVIILSDRADKIYVTLGSSSIMRLVDQFFYLERRTFIRSKRERHWSNARYRYVERKRH